MLHPDHGWPGWVCACSVLPVQHRLVWDSSNAVLFKPNHFPLWLRHPIPGLCCLLEATGKFSEVSSFYNCSSFFSLYPNWTSFISGYAHCLILPLCTTVKNLAPSSMEGAFPIGTRGCCCQVSPKLSLLQVRQAKLSRPLLTRQVFHSWPYLWPFAEICPVYWCLPSTEASKNGCSILDVV